MCIRESMFRVGLDVFEPGLAEMKNAVIVSHIASASKLGLSIIDSMDAAAQNIILLQSSDGVIFRVKEAAAVQSETLRDRVEAIEGNYADNIIPVPNVNSQILAKVIEYCERHVDAADDEDLRAFDAEFVRVDQSTLFDIILAANYLDIRSLLDLTCQTVVDVIKGKTPDEIRETFNIKNEFTPEEEEEV